MIPAPLAEALSYACATLRTCAPDQRDGIKEWIDRLLDFINVVK